MTIRGVAYHNDVCLDLDLWPQGQIIVSFEIGHYTPPYDHAPIPNIIDLSQKKQLFDPKVKGQGPIKVIMVCDTPPYGHAPTYQISLTQWYLICGCMTIRRCVAYRNDLSWDLDLWPQGNNETTWQIEIEHGMNVHWLVSYKICVVIKRVFPYYYLWILIIYCSFKKGGQASTLTYFSTCPFGQLTKKSTCPTQSFSSPKKWIKITKTKLFTKFGQGNVRGVAKQCFD
jgi:hypothetical protein